MTHSFAFFTSIIVIHGIHRIRAVPVALNAMGIYARNMMDDVVKAGWIADQLVDCYGIPEIHVLDPVENLVLTILSQNTTDTNRDRAFASLMQAFTSFDRIAVASVDEIARAIQVGGLQHQKSKAIKNALQAIKRNRDGLNLEFLRNLSLPQAMKWLQELPGVGPKTAGIVMLFSFERPYFPADTHIRRVMSRLGVVPKRGDPHGRLNRLLPADPVLMQHLHLLTIRLGREICRPKQPRCRRCPLQSECLWVTAHGSLPEDGVTSPIERGGRQP